MQGNRYDFGYQININKKLLLKKEYLKEKLSMGETNDITNLSHNYNSERKNDFIFNFNNIDSLNNNQSEMEDNTLVISEPSLNSMKIFNEFEEEEEVYSSNKVYFIEKNNNKNIIDNSEKKNNIVLNHAFETRKIGKKRGRKSSVNKNTTPREKPDDLERKIFNNFYKMICYLFTILTQKLGKEYKINKINKKSKDTDNQGKRKIFYERKFGYILCKSLPRNMNKDFKEKIEKEDNSHNKNIYDKLVKDGKLELEQSQAQLLKMLLNMECGEAFYKFMIGDNFIKKYEPNLEDFITFEQYRKKDLSGLYSEELINETKNNILKTLVKYE